MYGRTISQSSIGNQFSTTSHEEKETHHLLVNQEKIETHQSIVNQETTEKPSVLSKPTDGRKPYCQSKPKPCMVSNIVLRFDSGHRHHLAIDQVEGDIK